MPVSVTTLVDFNGADGANPFYGLIADGNGNLFGTTSQGGTPAVGQNNGGTVFEILKTATGYASTPIDLYSFSPSVPALGYRPSSGLLADASGNLFGIASQGGAFGFGAVFELKKTLIGYASSPITLVSFNDSNGRLPVGNLVADANGNLFGTTEFGNGASDIGTVFEIKKTATGFASTPLTLATFTGPNGFEPSGGVSIDASGNLFGTTASGGANGFGTVFEIQNTAAGYAPAPTTLVSFNNTNGAIPSSSLIEDAQGNLFGTTAGGGTFGPFGYGTVFEIKHSAAGYATTPTVLADFNNTNGANPFNSLIFDAQGSLFGTTQFGGANGAGTVFEIVKTGGIYATTPTIVASFPVSAARRPSGYLYADRSGNLFGTTAIGGPVFGGSVFEITGSGFVPIVPPTGFTFTPDTAALLTLESGGSGLTGNTPLGTFTQAGGTIGDSYGFTLAGPNANAFALTSASNAGPLTTDGGGDLGTRHGKLYALTIQVNDTTNGLNSGPLPFDVVVGRGGRDVISTATLGIAATTPTFIYGLGGRDTIDASSLTGPAWIAGGRGADTMTGGSGPNIYLYGSTRESAPSAFDVITNYNVSRDKIDLSGLGPTPLSFQASPIVGNAAIANHSIAWQISGANTFLYVNTSGGPETRANADMKIELLGHLSLTGSTIIHH